MTQTQAIRRAIARGDLDAARDIADEMRGPCAYNWHVKLERLSLATYAIGRFVRNLGGSSNVQS